MHAQQGPLASASFEWSTFRDPLERILSALMYYPSAPPRDEPFLSGQGSNYIAAEGIRQCREIAPGQHLGPSLAACRRLRALTAPVPWILLLRSSSCHEAAALQAWVHLDPVHRIRTPFHQSDMEKFATAIAESRSMGMNVDIDTLKTKGSCVFERIFTHLGVSAQSLPACLRVAEMFDVANGGKQLHRRHEAPDHDPKDIMNCSGKAEPRDFLLGDPWFRNVAAPWRNLWREKADPRLASCWKLGR